MSIEETGRPDGDDIEAIQELRRAHDALAAELGKVIVGQRAVVEQMLIALFCRSHAIIVGVPGLAKTLLVRTIAEILDLKFKRIQFTPDLMPSDILGTEIIQEDPATRARELRFFKGPIFANVLLADEINRTPPKTQAALLEAMEERRITVAGKTYDLDPPFFVLATQNPIEQEGTYPLPEAALDRFMFSISIEYPPREEEAEIVRRTTALHDYTLSRVLGSEDILRAQRVVRKIPVSEGIVRYAIALAAATRPQDESSTEYVRRYIRWGAGVRAGQFLVLGAKARSVLRGMYSVSAADVRAVAPSVMRHRIIPNFHAESEGVSTDDLIRRVLDDVKAP